MTSLLREEVPGADALGGLGDDDVMARDGRCAGDRKSNDAGTDDEDLHGHASPAGATTSPTVISPPVTTSA